MKPNKLIFRSITFYWGTSLAFILAVAIGTASISGSLLVGASVPKSIEKTALAKLGGITHTLKKKRFFRADLANELIQVKDYAEVVQKTSPAIVVRTAAKNQTAEINVSQINAVGVEDNFWEFYPETNKFALGPREAILNQSLATALSVEQGGSLILTLRNFQSGPSDTLFAHRKQDATIQNIRVTVKDILPDSGVGSFSLEVDTKIPKNIFVQRRWLSRYVAPEEDVCNTVFIQSSSEELSPVVAEALEQICNLQDYDFKTQQLDRYLILQNSEFLLSSAQIEAAKKAATKHGAEISTTSIYLANTISNISQKRRFTIPYSVVMGTQPKAFLPVSTSGIFLNSWAATELQVTMGDQLELKYYVAKPSGEYVEERKHFNVQGIIKMDFPLVNSKLIPQFKGLTNAETIDEWELPFPVDKKLIREHDEEYWKEHQAAAKAFIHLDIMKSFWKHDTENLQENWLTSIIVNKSNSGENFNQQFLQELPKSCEPFEMGFGLQPVRQIALKTSKGSTDFGALFISMSFFITLASAGFIAMLSRLSIIRRASAMGILQAQGFKYTQIRALFLQEGFVLALVGSVLGIVLGILYADFIVFSLQTWWKGAIGTTTLWLYVAPEILVVGGFSGIAVSIFSMWLGVRYLKKQQAIDLLRNWQALEVSAAQKVSKSPKIIVAVLFGVAGTLVWMGQQGEIPAAAAFFGSGSALLTGGILLGYVWMTATLAKVGKNFTSSLLRLRNLAIYRKQSMIIIGLFSCASFILIAVGANRLDFSQSDTTQNPGTGGFTLQAISSVPIYYDFDTEKGRENLNFAEKDKDLYKDVKVFSFLYNFGDDISCRNLANPGEPRILGVSNKFISRGGFSLITKENPQNPWNLLKQTTNDGSIPVFGDANSVMWQLQSGLGKTITSKIGNQEVKLQFVGLLRNSIFASEILMSQENFQKLFPDIDAPSYYLVETTRESELAIAKSLRQNLGEAGLEVFHTRDVLNSFIEIQNTYLSAFLTLGGIGIILGTFGLMTVLLYNALRRRSEFALMLAVGFTPLQIVSSLLKELTFLLLWGLFCGTCSALIAIIPQITSVEAEINWQVISGLITAVFIFAMVICIVTVKLSIRENLLQSLRAE